MVSGGGIETTVGHGLATGTMLPGRGVTVIHAGGTALSGASPLVTAAMSGR